MTTTCATLTDPRADLSHPSWCCGEWCEPTFHASGPISWKVGDGRFEANIVMTDDDVRCNQELGVYVTVEVTSPSGVPFIFLSPDELRLTAHHLLAIAEQAEGGGRDE